MDLDLLPQELIDAIVSLAVDNTYEEGELLFAQGQPARCLVILERGDVEVSVIEEDGTERVLAVRSVGSILGEMAYVMGARRTAQVRAITRVNAKLLPSAAYYDLASRFPMLEAALGHLVASRLGDAAGDVLCGTEVGGYRLEQCIGRGARGVVYTAHAPDGQRVAIKMLNYNVVLDASAVQRFIEHELPAIRQLQHPHIARVYDAILEHRTCFIVMEHCDGLSLSTMAARLGSLGDRPTLGILGQIALALQCVHEAGMVHQNLKPSNVFLTRRGLVRVLDFGMGPFLMQPSRAAAPAGPASNAPVLGSTPLYLAPEQHRPGEVGARADLYALGCIGYELLTGNPPFSKRSASIAQLLAQKLAFRLMPDRLPPGTSDLVQRFLAIAMQPDPSLRNPAILDALASSIGDDHIPTLAALVESAGMGGDQILGLDSGSPHAA
jgi:CRP-like cAMP-binding protein